MSYMGGNYENAPLGAWKPPSNYLPRGEAPPPYEEAMAQCRPETMRLLYIFFKVFITGQYFVDSTIYIVLIITLCSLALLLFFLYLKMIIKYFWI